MGGHYTRHNRFCVNYLLCTISTPLAIPLIRISPFIVYKDILQFSKRTRYGFIAEQADLISSSVKSGNGSMLPSIFIFIFIKAFPCKATSILIAFGISPVRLPFSNGYVKRFPVQIAYLCPPFIASNVVSTL